MKYDRIRTDIFVRLNLAFNNGHLCKTKWSIFHAIGWHEMKMWSIFHIVGWPEMNMCTSLTTHTHTLRYTDSIFHLRTLKLQNIRCKIFYNSR